MTARLSLAAVNALDRARFVAALGEIFEHSPWVAEAVWPARPFATLAALRRAMVGAVANAGRDRQLALIRAHPELAAPEDRTGPLTELSRAEQAGIGFAAGGGDARRRQVELNARYRARFGFPFVIAVRGRGRDEILAAMAARLGNDRETEIATALDEIAQIAAFRLNDLLGTNQGGGP